MCQSWPRRVYLVREKSEAPVAAIKVAKVEGFSAQFLRKTLNLLVVAGILRQYGG